MKKLLFVLGGLPGFLFIFITVVANRMVSGVNTSFADTFLKFGEYFNMNISREATAMVAFAKINEYSHWIITFSIVWIVVFAFLWERQRRKEKDEKD